MTTMTELAGAHWRKSALSQNGSACVEVAFVGSLIYLRDSKYRRDPRNEPDKQPIISIPASRWQQFLESAAHGSDAPTEIRIKHHKGGGATVADELGVELIYTAEEWDAFTEAVASNDFISV